MDAIATINLTSMVRAAGRSGADVLAYAMTADGAYVVLSFAVGEFAVHTVNPMTGAVTSGQYFDRNDYTGARDAFTVRSR